MGHNRFNGPSKLDEARAWLRTALADGEAHRAGEVQKAGLSAGIKRRTLQLAASYEAEIKPKHGERGVETWLWTLK